MNESIGSSLSESQELGTLFESNRRKEDGKESKWANLSELIYVKFNIFDFLLGKCVGVIVMWDKLAEITCVYVVRL